MLKQRVVTALILTALFFGVLCWGAAPWFSLFVAVAVLLAAWEWASLSGFRKKISRAIYVCVIFSLLIAAGFYLHFFILGVAGFSNSLHLINLKNLLIASVTFWAFALLLVQSYPSSALLWGNKWLRLVMGVFVLLPTCIALVFVRQQAMPWVILLIGLVAAADIGGYFAGRQFGKRKLAVEVSPGKTWEGFMGGLLANILLAAILTSCTHYTLVTLLILIVPASLASVLGDLFESMIKRHAGVKDSGTLLPGHGGILDRVDGITAAAPVFALSLLATGLATVGV